MYIYRYIYINIRCGMDPEGGVSTPASQCLPTEDVPANSKKKLERARTAFVIMENSYFWLGA